MNGHCTVAVALDTTLRRARAALAHTQTRPRSGMFALWKQETSVERPRCAWYDGRIAPCIWRHREDQRTVRTVVWPDGSEADLGCLGPWLSRSGDLCDGRCAGGCLQGLPGDIAIGATRAVAHNYVYAAIEGQPEFMPLRVRVYRCSDWQVTLNPVGLYCQRGCLGRCALRRLSSSPSRGNRGPLRRTRTGAL
jgi:hypothetical protein